MVAARRALLVVAFALVAVSALAQTEVRYYVVPKIGGTNPLTDPFRAKYLDPGALGPEWNVSTASLLNYGLESIFFVALDLSVTDHTLLTAQPDVLAVPSPIANPVSVLALTTVQTKLEAANIPGDWVTTSMTYQQVLSRAIRIVLFMQRYSGIFGRLFSGGATLDTRINQLPFNARQALNSAAQQLGANTSSITGTTLIRQALVIVADQIFTEGVPFGDVTF